MDPISPPLVAALLGATALVALAPKAKRRIALSRAKHRSLAGHSRMARRLAGLLPYYAFEGRDFFRSDDPTEAVAEARRAGFERLAAGIRERKGATLALSSEAREGISDLQFIDRYRVPFQFARVVQNRLGGGSFLRASDGVELIDLDGNRAYDLTGSYGVNVFGHRFYKDCLERAQEIARDLGPVLGSYHPVVADNVQRLRALSGQDEVSFHMSGTEAVMQAVRLARYHTGRRRIVRFCGAYHGWWGEVQPGIGNPVPARDTFTLSEMSERTLGVLRGRGDVACVLVNPIQALHPNANPPSDGGLVDSSRSARFDRAAYTDWLKQLRQVCTERGIVLIIDDVFMGFRIAPGGSQEYFGVKADLVTYGKTLGGGLPVGVLCGRADMMRRFREDRPGDVCFARGTFNSHPYVMAAMNTFLRRLEEPAIQDLYDGLHARWDRRAAGLNERLAAAGLPVTIANFSTIWTVSYTRPGRYNWMLQYYLRAQGLALPWTGTGRLVFSLDFTEADFEAVSDRFVAAARAMAGDGWWSGGLETNKVIRRRILRETLAARFGRKPGEAAQTVPGAAEGREAGAASSP